MQTDESAPFSAGTLAQPGSPLARIADRLKLSPGEVALAWVLKRSPVMLPTPGTANPDHLAQNVEAASAPLSDEEFRVLDQQGREAWEKAKHGS